MKRLVAVAAIAAILGGLVGGVGTAVVSSQTTPPLCGADPEACLAVIQQALTDHAAATSTSTTTTTEVPTSTSTSISSSTTTSTVPATSSSISPTSSQPSTTTTLISTTSSTVPSSTSSSSTSSVPPSTTTTTVRPSIQPDATNTGVPAGTALTNYSGCTVPSGATVDAKTFNCSSVSIGSNVTITRSRINGNAFSVIQNPGSGLSISDSELSCGRSAGSYGINGGNGATFTRMNVHDCENAIEPGNDVTFQDSWVHDMKAQSGGHNDGISIDGAHSNVKILRNNVVMTLPGSCYDSQGRELCGTPTSSVMVDNWPSGSLTGIVVDGNWLAGGQFVMYLDSQFSSGTITATVTNNKFAGGVFGFCNRSASKVTLTQSGNTPTARPC